jgi:hypothetical protein
MNDRIRRLQSLIAMAEAKQKILEQYNLDSIGERTLIDEMRTMVEDEKKMALLEANRPVIIQPSRKNWQDNPWLYFIMGVAITVIGLIIYNAILR